MRINASGSTPSTRGEAGLFTGTVWIDFLQQPTTPSRAQVQHVTFEPGSRTFWHSHPLGQLLIVTAGAGWIQRKDGPVTEIRAGDIVSIPPGEVHWHGATSEQVMSFLAVQEALDGKVVDPLGPVSDEDYLALRPRSVTR